MSAGQTNWFQIIGWSVGAFFAVLIIHQLREPWESAVAIGVAWGAGIWFTQQGKRKP